MSVYIVLSDSQQRQYAALNKILSLGKRRNFGIIAPNDDFISYTVTYCFQYKQKWTYVLSKW